MRDSDGYRSRKELLAGESSGFWAFISMMEETAMGRSNQSPSKSNSLGSCHETSAGRHRGKDRFITEVAGDPWWRSREYVVRFEERGAWGFTWLYLG